MQELKPIKEGKVREIYDNGESLIMVATDRISCFDVILHNEVTKKGTVLTQMSKFWFDMTQDILPNHMISVDTKDMPEFFQQEKYEGTRPLHFSRSAFIRTPHSTVSFPQCTMPATYGQPINLSTSKEASCL